MRDDERTTPGTRLALGLPFTLRRLHADMLTAALFALFASAQLATAQSPSCAERTPLSPGAVSATHPVSGATVGIIDAASLAPFSDRTLSQALTARLPGVSVLQSSGVASAGARVRMRGPGGILMTQEPLLFIDGIRVEGTLHSMGLNAGGQAPSRLNDVAVDDVDCIFVLRGPAATARYGTDAAGGVIHVLTHRAARDSTRVRVALEGGATADVTDYPDNYGTAGGTCTRARAALGQCVAGALSTWNPLEAVSPFRTAPRLHAAGRANVASGPRLSLGVSGSGTIADGTLRNDRRRRFMTSAAIEANPNASVSVQGDLWVMGGASRMPQVGNFTLSILNAGLLGNSIDDPVRRGYRNLPLGILEQFKTDQHTRRMGGVGRVRWSPNGWLSVRALAGREDSRVRDEQFDPSVLFSTPPQVGPPSTRATAAQRAHRTSAQLSASATYGSVRTRLTTDLSLDYLDDTDRLSSRVSGPQLLSESFRENDQTTTGITVRQAVTLADRVLLDGGARYDILSRNFVNLKNAFYPFASAAWNLVRRSPESSALSTLRLRAAYGESGDSRSYRIPLDLVATIPDDTDDTPSEWPVEHTRELEGGVDLGMLNDRLIIDATYFSKRTSDALIASPNPPGPGGTTGGIGIITSAAAWQNRGIEIGARARVVDAPSVRADIAVNFTSVKNKVLELGSRSAIIGANYRIEPGYPLYGTWGRRFTATDQNGDGVIVPAEVISDDTPSFLGPATPTRELGVAPSITLGRAVTIAALLDYRGGFRTVNSGGRLRCNAVCEALYVPGASVADQARAVDPNDAAAGWIEDASFIRLRELAVSWTIPAAWSRAIGAHASSLVLAGRNLAIRTDYSGLDPEVTYTGQASILQEDLFALPLARTISLRLDVRW